MGEGEAGEGRNLYFFIAAGCEKRSKEMKQY
jgi:hypothetical protein